MNFADKQKKLLSTVTGNPTASSVFPKTDLLLTIEEIAVAREITFGQIGEICELVRQIITKEKPVEDFEANLKEKLADDEDALAKVGEIVAAINEKIFVKLLPALGLKALPIVEKPKVAAPLPPSSSVETEVTDSTSASSFTPREKPSTAIPLKKALPVAPFATPRPTPPLPNRFPNLSNVSPVLNLKPFSGAPSPQLSKMTEPKIPATPISFSPAEPKLKPPIMEPDHESMSENQTDSFLKMLSGKLNEKDLQSRFDKLPLSLKTALRSIDSAKKVVDIGRKYALHVDKLGMLAEETGLVILGMTHPAQFLPRLNRKLGIGEEKVAPIAQEINAEIFLKIREALKQVNGEAPSYPQPEIKPIPVPAPVPISTPQPIRATPQEEYRPAQPAPSLQEAHNWSTNITATKPTNVIREEAGEVLDRNAILSEIENSTSGVMKIPPAITRPPEPRPVPKVEVSPVPPPTPKFVSTPPHEPPAPVTPAQIPKPIQILKNEPAPVKSEPQSIIDQKLSSPTASAKSETSYSADPYREPF